MHISDFKIDGKKAFFVGIIINELLINVLKYAFGDHGKGMVSVSIDKEEGNVQLSIWSVVRFGI
jgi:two-component sensor histidine kinase